MKPLFVAFNLGNGSGDDGWQCLFQECYKKQAETDCINYSIDEYDVLQILLNKGQLEIFNTNCRIINFIHCLKERCNLDPEECVDLVDRSGELVNLWDREQSIERASSLLRDRHSYILLRVIRGDGVEGPKFEPLLSDQGKNHRELTELLKKLSNPHKDRDKRNLSRRGWPQRDASTNHASRTKRATTPKKSAVTPRNL